MPLVKRENSSELLAAVLLGAGVGLRLMQYLGGASQWLDEAMLSSSIVPRTLTQLLTVPLDYGQSAPPGWLFVEKLAVMTLGPSDLSLRLVPFAASVVTLLACFVASRGLLSPIGRPIAMALLAFAAPLCIFSGQVKQYSSDVAIATCLLLLVLRLHAQGVTWSKAGCAAVAGAVAVWFSLPAVLVMGGLFSGLAWSAWKERSQGGRAQLVRLAVASAVWGASGLAALAQADSAVSPERHQALQSYFSAGFMPQPPWQLASVKWLIGAASRPFGGAESAGLWYPANRLFALLMLAGFWALSRRVPRQAAILAGPLLVTLFAAVVHLYPFYDRLILFLVPTLLFAVGEGIAWVADRAGQRMPAARLPVAVLLSLPALYPVLGALPPYAHEDIKPVLAHLQAHRKPGDRVYVYHAAEPAFRYYSASFGLGTGDYRIGKCHNGDPRGYFTELEDFRGTSRLWLVIAHDLPTNDDRAQILSYLDAVGARIDQVLTAARSPANSGVWPITADAYLYDLSDRSRPAPTPPPRDPSGPGTLGCN